MSGKLINKYEIALSAFKEQTEQNLETSSNIAEWKMYEYTYKMPDNMDKLRIEVNVLSPGIFWIDAIGVEEVK